MNTTRLKTVGLFMVVFGFFAGAVLLSTGNLGAANPTGVTVTLYQSDLYADKNASAVAVFTDAAGIPVDIVSTPDKAFGQGTVAAGSYKRIKFLVKNKVTFAGPDPCITENPPVITETFLIDLTKADDAQVDLYFATSADGGGAGWTANGSSANPFLMQDEIEVQGGATTVVKLIFNTADTLQCVSNTPKLFPPTMEALHYVEQPAPAACGSGGDYWVLHFRAASIPVDQDGNPIPDPSFEEIIMSGMVVSGWGTVSLGPLSPDNTGTSVIFAAPTYEEGGMAEHRHRLAYYDPDDQYEQGYSNPSSPPGTPDLTGTYSMYGNTIITQSKDGIINMGLSTDCSTFVGARLTGRYNDLILGVKKPASAPTIADGTKFLTSTPSFEIVYDDTTTIPGLGHPAKFFVYNGGINVMEASTTNGKKIEWHNLYQLHQWQGQWSAFQNSERADYQTGDLSVGINVRDDGLVTLTGEPGFAALGVNGTGIIAGLAVEIDTQWNSHRVYPGLFLNTHADPALKDLTGTWKVGTIRGGVRDTDGIWNSGNEVMDFGVQYGSATIASNGDVCWMFMYKNTLTGKEETHEGCGTLVRQNECYECDAETDVCQPLTKTPCDGISLPVFHVVDVNDNTVIAKLSLDKAKNVMAIWSPLDTDNTPFNSEPSPTCSPNNCGDPRQKFEFGVGVKISE